MQFLAKAGAADKLRTACLITAVYENKKLSPGAAALDKVSGGAITEALKSGDLKGKTGQTLMLRKPAGLACERLLLVGAGTDEELSDANYRELWQSAIHAVKATAAKEATALLLELPVKGRDARWKANQAAEAASQALYLFDETKSEKKPEDRPALAKLTLLTAGAAETRAAEQGIRQGEATAAGVALARTLGNLPGNICTPTYLGEQAKAIGRKYKTVKVSVLDAKAMEKLGMGALLSVAKGSRQPPRLIVMEYKPAGARNKPVVLVGKGLTFDAGGISLKPAADMDQMKFDMCGGASVLGAMQAIAELGLKLNVVAVVPSSENLPDGNANKPGDIVTAMSGQTIEILNTDAEGRLILCDALTYARRFNPEVVIDVATLTGACVVALGKHAAGVLGNDQDLVDGLLAAGQTSGDRAWQLPLWDEYQEQLKSNFADVANVGGRYAGAITGACFLSRFTKDLRWAHLDVAGVAWAEGGDKGATGRPVPLLVQYLVDRAGWANDKQPNAKTRRTQRTQRL